MEQLLAAPFAFLLFKAVEVTVENLFGAPSAQAEGALKGLIQHWTKRDTEGQRQAAFGRAVEKARERTWHGADAPQQARAILDALLDKGDEATAGAFAEEAARLMLFSASPDLPRLTKLCREKLKWDSLWAREAPPSPETVATILADFLTNLREALLDEEPYYELIQGEILRTLRQIHEALRPALHDDEATYRYQLAQHYRQLDFVGIPELKERRPITVEDIFIHLRAEQEPERQERELLDTYRQAEEAGDREALAKLRDARNAIAHGLAPQSPAAIEEILRQAKQVVVLGHPGSGKTTLLKYLVVLSAEGRARAELGLGAEGDGSLLPIFVPLREFAAECAGRSQDYCLLDYLYTHAREHLLLNLPARFFEEALEAGRCLVCLDGLDEVWVVGQRKEVSDAVGALASRYPRNRYLVTSRIVGYEEAPLDRRQFAHYTVLPLEMEEIREFVRKWYTVRERDLKLRGRQTRDFLNTIERTPGLQSLAQNPLLLTIIVLVHRIEAELPHERVKLYDKCVTALVETWDSVKQLSIEEKQRPFYRRIRRLLERLAYELHTRAGSPGQLQVVKGGDLELLLTRFLQEDRSLALADDPDTAREETKAFVRLVRGRTGLLIERGDGVYSFPHLTFQEYLAACDIKKRCVYRGIGAIWGEIESRLHEPHWREVLLLLIGSLSEYGELTTLLVERILEERKDDPFEETLHRHLYLAARVLADHIEVAEELRRRIVDALLKIAREAPSWERSDAFSALCRLSSDRHTAGELLALARDERVDDMVREEAAEALGRLGRVEEATELLLALARDERVEDVVREEAAEALGRLGRVEEAKELLLALAQDERVQTGARWAAALAPGRLGLAEKVVLDGLLVLARDERVEAVVRWAATEALGELGHVEEAKELFLALARDERVQVWVRQEAAEALGGLGCVGEAVELLLALARNKQVLDMLRREATKALGRLGHADKEVLDGLLALARDKRVASWVREEAAEALGRLGRVEEAVALLLPLARNKRLDDIVREKAAEALGRLGCVEEAAELLLALARDEWVGDVVRQEAAAALVPLGRVEEAKELFLALARDERAQVWVRQEAYESLKKLAGEATEQGQ